MKFDVLTLFPEMFEPIKQSIIKRAVEKDLININLVNIRDFSEDKHNKVDDTPYGGGAGMLMKPDVVDRAYNSVKTENAKVIYLTPQGKTLDQKIVKELSNQKHLILLCGHYEGIDQRVIDKIVDEEISIGDYVLTGGELAAAVICDSVIRLLDNAIRKESSEDDSFSDGLLEYPQYTRPVEYKGCTVPEVLLNGNHKLIREFRLKESLRKTILRRPDLLKNRNLTKEEERLLSMLQAELAADKNNA